MVIDFTKVDTKQKQDLLHGAVVPRPIGLVSTIDCDGVPNLAPFSFFNVVSIEPPVLIFAPSCRVRDNTTKHTIENIREVPEAVVHIVSYPMIRQMNLTACEYAESVDEFIKAGFTREKASRVRPWMIKECAVKLECRIKEMRSLGSQGGAGTVCFAEVVAMHIDSSVLDAQNQIDPLLLEPVARLGTDQYCVVNKNNLFTMPKPNRHLGIGFDNLPAHILNSTVLSANELGQLAMLDKVPVMDKHFSHTEMLFVLEQPVSEKRMKDIHSIASQMLRLNLVNEAWQVLLRVNMVTKPEEDMVLIDRMD